MLESPKYGWSKLSIGDKWSERVSYLDDVPYMLIDAVESVVRVKRPYAVKFDAEGFDYIVVFDVFETHIITESSYDDGFTYFTFATDIDRLALELVEDIRRDIEAWSVWTDYGGMPEEERLERRADLLAACDILEKRAKR